MLLLFTRVSSITMDSDIWTVTESSLYTELALTRQPLVIIVVYLQYREQKLPNRGPYAAYERTIPRFERNHESVGLTSVAHHN